MHDCLVSIGCDHTSHAEAVLQVLGAQRRIVRAEWCVDTTTHHHRHHRHDHLAAARETYPGDLSELDIETISQFLGASPEFTEGEDGTVGLEDRRNIRPRQHLCLHEPEYECVFVRPELDSDD